MSDSLDDWLDFRRGENPKPIKEHNPIRRLKEVFEAISELDSELDPFYRAQKLILPEDFEGDGGFSHLESLPAFHKPWLKRQELEREKDRILLALGCAWEQCPIDPKTFGL